MLLVFKFLIYLVALSGGPSFSDDTRRVCQTLTIRNAEAQLIELEKKLPQEIDLINTTHISPRSRQNYSFNDIPDRIFSFHLKDKSVIYVKLDNQITVPAHYEKFPNVENLKRYLESFGMRPEFERLGSGGTRVSFLDRSMGGKTWKRYKLSFDANEAANMCAREEILTKFTNQFFANVEEEIGISLEVVPHDYSLFGETGWVSQLHIEGIPLDEYRQGLSKRQKDEFLLKQAKLKDKLVEANIAAGKMNNKLISPDWHMHKGIDQHTIKKYRQKYPNPDTYVEVMSERGNLADIDLGLLEQRYSDLNNCFVTGIKMLKGVEIPIVKCFDI